jgi:hypothetical protein
LDLRHLGLRRGVALLSALEALFAGQPLSHRLA